MSSIQPVVLCGGAGTRLWPASRPDRPKPLLSLVGDRSLLAATIERFAGPPFSPPWVVCGEGHAEPVAAEVPGVRVLVEPAARGTAAAVTLAATTADPDTVLLVVPADHVVSAPDVLREAVIRAVPAARDGWIVTFGVVPTAPATGYGWIAPGDPLQDGVQRVAQFLEKPDRPTAERFLASGRFLWNSGMFLFRAGSLLDEVDRWAPGLRGADPVSGSIDVLLMEQTTKAAVVPVSCGWSDVGTWAAVAAARGGSSGPVTTDGSPGTFVWSDGPQVAVFDAPGLVIVASGGGVLVASPDAADRCGAMAFAASERVDHGPGWDVRRTRLAAGEEVVLTEVSVLVSGALRGAVRGEVLTPGTWVALRPSVVVTVQTER